MSHEVASDPALVERIVADEGEPRLPVRRTRISTAASAASTVQPTVERTLAALREATTT